MRFLVTIFLSITGSWLFATTVHVPTDSSDLHASVRLLPGNAVPAGNSEELMPSPLGRVEEPAAAPVQAQSVIAVPETTGVAVFAFLGVLFMLRRRSA